MIARAETLRWIFLLALVWLALLPSNLIADVLVTTDGQRIETKGPWRIEGKKVVFETAAGTLSMLRLSAVDLEASELATNPPPPPEPPPEPPKSQVKPKAKPKKPVMTLTNKTLQDHQNNVVVRIARKEHGYSQNSAQWMEMGGLESANAGFALDEIERIAAKYPSLDKMPADLQAFQKIVPDFEKCAKEIRELANDPHLKEARPRLAQRLLESTASNLESIISDAEDDPERAWRWFQTRMEHLWDQ